MDNTGKDVGIVLVVLIFVVGLIVLITKKHKDD